MYIKKLLLFTSLFIGLKSQETSWQKNFKKFDREERIRATDEMLNLFLREVNPKTNYEPVLSSVISKESEERVSGLINNVIEIFKSTSEVDYKNKFDKMTTELLAEAQALSLNYLNALAKTASELDKQNLTKRYNNDQLRIAKNYREKSEKAKAEIKGVLLNYYFKCYNFMAKSANYNPIVYVKFDKNSKELSPIAIAPELRAKL